MDEEIEIVELFPNSGKMFVCPFCGRKVRKGDNFHTRKCMNKYISLMTEETKKDWYDKYINEEYSLVDMTKYTNLPYHTLLKMFPLIGIPLRKIKDAASTKRVRKKYEETCMEHFGTPHNFSKNCSSRKKWEKRLLKEEGITNVFQRESVKKKIKKTSIERYGKDFNKIVNSKEYIINKWINEGLSQKEAEEKYLEYCKSKGNGNRLDYYLSKYGEDGYKIFLRHSEKNVYSGNSISSLNIRFRQMLDDLNITNYEAEFPIIPPFMNEKREDTRNILYYDFKIENYLFELNGDYWHANPHKYKPDDVIHYPNNLYLTAAEVWKRDEYKKDVAELNGYIVIHIWEEEMNNEEIWLNEFVKVFKKYAELLNKVN